MKRLLIILPLAVLLCGILTGWLGGSGMERHLEKQLGIDLPAGAAITYEDSHGGFHGDGVLTVVVECSDPDKAEGLIDDISQRWRESPIEPELWEQFRAAMAAKRRTDTPSAGGATGLLVLPGQVSGAIWKKV